MEEIKKAINELRNLHNTEMAKAIQAHERLRVAEQAKWEDSWKFEDDFHEAWYRAAGIFSSIKALEVLLYNIVFDE